MGLRGSYRVDGMLPLVYSLTGADVSFFFFFQAEDGIRDVAVTGVQTCALPILLGVGQKHDAAKLRSILNQPTDAMADGGMQPVDVREEDLAALIAFLESLK